MNFPSLRLALVAGLVVPLGLGAASFAQDAAPAQPGPGAADAGAPHHHRDPAEMRAHMADHLRTALQLQPGQDGALNAFLDALQPPAGAKEHMARQAGGMQHMTTPERLDRMAARMDEQRSRMMARIAATKQFYAQLSPSQQKAFDNLGPMMMHHGMRGDGQGDRHGDRGHDGDHGMGSDGPPRG
jgi:hypothetical protein